MRKPNMSRSVNNFIEFKKLILRFIGCFRLGSSGLV